MKDFGSNIRNLGWKDFWKAVGVGLATAVLLSIVMATAFSAGITPLPKQPSLAFAEALLRRDLPLPVGLFFHLVYVTFWSVAYVALFRDRMSFLKALWLALALWVVALVILFPIIGWGFLGLNIGPKAIMATLMPHLLFAFFLWAGCRLVFQPTARLKTGHGNN